MADAHEAFVRRFRAAWRNPSPDALNALLHPDVRLEQPLTPPVVGRDQAGRYWSRVLGVMPDARAEVLEWAARGDLVFIRFRMSATLGRRPVDWIVTDRVRLEDGLVKERVASFDSLPLALAAVTRPSAWPALLRAGRRR